MRFWSNLVGYQLVWLAAVQGASRGTAWVGVGAAASFVIWQWLASDERREDLRLLAASILCGILIDGLLAERGWVRYAAPMPALPPQGAPAWILALWAAFSMTLNHSLRYLRDRASLGLICGALGAPLAYLAAQRAGQAVYFAPPEWRGLAALGAAWAIALPVLACLARRGVSRAAAATGAP